MAFAPTSTIFLCQVAIDNTYKNQVYFREPSEQIAYFSGKVKKTFSDYLTVRKNKDGALISSVKVDANIDDLYGLNYMYYQNANHGTRYFYCFITNLTYINEGTTEIEFETDVYQTWRFNTTLLDSFVVREHSNTDEIGDNLIPESFNAGEFIYSPLYIDQTLDTWGYLIAATESLYDDAEGTNLVELSGICQGVHFYYFEEQTELEQALNALFDKGDECVISVSLIPRFNTSDNVVIDGVFTASDSPATKHIVIDTNITNESFEGYAPTNKKMLTSPYTNLIVTNHNGQECIYNFEDFLNPEKIEFVLTGDVSVNPTLKIYPTEYKTLSHNYDEGLTIGGFPQIALNTDTFKLWLAKNQYGSALSIAGGAASIIAGGAALATGAGATAGIGMITGGAMAIANTINNGYKASREPNRYHGGETKSNLLTAMGINKFDFYIRTLRRDQAIAIDQYFTMFGYACNKVKRPNVSSRPYFNYVQTIDCNIEGFIPDDDMRRLKQMYNDGVTLWKPNAAIGNYAVDNSP